MTLYFWTLCCLKKNGFEVLKQLRSREIKNSGNNAYGKKMNWKTKIHGLDLGADDYITKPFAFFRTSGKNKSYNKKKL